MQRGGTDRRDKFYLKAIRGGLTARQVAAKFNVCIRTVYNGVCRARLAEQPAGPQLRSPTLVPLFPVDSYTPTSKCPHHCGDCSGRGFVKTEVGRTVPCGRCRGTGAGPVPPGSRFVCMVCRQHSSGQDNHPALRRNPHHDPKPEPRLDPKPEPKRTRRQRRKFILTSLKPGVN